MPESTITMSRLKLLPSDFSFHIDIPDYVQEILNSEISVTEEGE